MILTEKSACSRINVGNYDDGIDESAQDDHNLLFFSLRIFSRGPSYVLLTDCLWSPGRSSVGPSNIY